MCNFTPTWLVYQKDYSYVQFYAILNCRIVEYKKVSLCTILRQLDLRTKKIILMYNFTLFSIAKLLNTRSVFMYNFTSTWLAYKKDYSYVQFYVILNCSIVEYKKVSLCTILRQFDLRTKRKDNSYA